MRATLFEEEAEHSIYPREERVESGHAQGSIDLQSGQNLPHHVTERDVVRPPNTRNQLASSTRPGLSCSPESKSIATACRRRVNRRVAL